MPLTAYTYTAAECGLVTLPPGTLRLAGFEATRDSAAADVFILPCDIKYVTNAQIHALPHLPANERRHVAFCISDQPERVLGLPMIVFRGDANTGILQREPTSVAWPWPVKDLGEWSHPPDGGFAHDVCFVGWNSTPLTGQACAAVEREARSQRMMGNKNGIGNKGNRNKWSPEMHERMKGKMPSRKGVHFKLTEEQRKKRSEANKGKPWTEKRRAAYKVWNPSPEIRKRISEGRKGISRPWSAKHWEAYFKKHGIENIYANRMFITEAGIYSLSRFKRTRKRKGVS